MKQLAISSGANFVDDGRLQINEYGAWNVLPGSSLAKESVEGIVSLSNGLVRGHLKAEESVTEKIVLTLTNDLSQLT